MSHDELPEELDVTAYVGPYLFPDTKRRRLAATIYVVLVVACLAGFAVTGNGGALAAAIVLALVVAYHLACAWRVAQLLRVELVEDRPVDRDPQGLGERVEDDR